jgi:hypothetical protein
MPSTLAYAPTPQELDEYFFAVPVLARRDEDDEPEQGEP